MKIEFIFAGYEYEICVHPFWLLIGLIFLVLCLLSK